MPPTTVVPLDQIHAQTAPDAFSLSEDYLLFPEGGLFPLTLRSTGLIHKGWNGLRSADFIAPGIPMFYSLTLRRLQPDTAGHALRARRALQDATRALAEVAQHRLELDRAKLILSMAAHDLRNPLAVIQSATDLLYRYGDRLSEEEREKRRTRIAESIRFMKSLLDDILLMSKAGSPAFSIHLESLDIKAFCHQVLADIAQTVSEYRLHFECPEQDVSAITDPKLLRHILTNLLENAVRYSPAGSTVTLSLERQSDRVILRVRDQGIGIPAADHARLFEPFFRASNAGNIRGNGLGLTIVRQAVEALGGSIAVESAEGQGSTFTVTLPLLSADE
jgi:signal transduction histidine kinase